MARNAEMNIYAHGIVAVRPFVGEVNVAGIRNHVRGKSEGKFTMASRRRLRTFLVKNKVDDSLSFGVTLTLPSAQECSALGDDDFGARRTTLLGGVERDYYHCFNHFAIQFHRRYPHSAMVYRNELQTRGAPHTHCIIYLHRDDFPGFDWVQGSIELEQMADRRLRGSNGQRRSQLRPIRYALIDMWANAVGHNLYLDSADKFATWKNNMRSNHGFLLRLLDNQQAIVRYIVDDMSKRKREQLGYIGRQWGIINRAAFSTALLAECSDRARILLQRILGKCRRRRVPDSCVFGYRRSRYYPCDSGASYLADKTVQQCMSIALALAEDDAGIKGEGGASTTPPPPPRHQPAAVHEPKHTISPKKQTNWPRDMGDCRGGRKIAHLDLCAHITTKTSRISWLDNPSC